MKRLEQKKLRREQIITAALGIFLKKGFHGAKVSEIAKEVGVSVGLLFHYFKSKEEVYIELIYMGLTGPASVMNMPSQNPVEFFTTAAALILAELEKNDFSAKMFAFMIQALINPANETAKKLLSSLDIIKASVPSIEAGQKAGVFKQGDPHALALAFWSAVNGIALFRVIDSQCPLPKADWLIDILLK